jgi:uridine kinase
VNAPLLIGIAGGSGCGKTTLAQALRESFAPEEVQVLQIDAYYLERKGLTKAQRSAINYDHPAAIDEDLLLEHLRGLKRGEDIEQPVYDYTIHDRTERTTRIRASRFVLVEGIFTLALKRVRPLLDLKIYVDTDSDLRILRRLQRDMRERARSLDSVVEQYLNTVRPMHLAFIEPSRRHADLIVPWADHNPVALDLLRAWVRGHVRV